jgi:hypothetical protein
VGTTVVNSWQLGVFIGVIVAATLAFIWLAIRFEHHHGKTPKKGKDSKTALLDEANQEAEHIFNDEFREELKNRGRLHFEKIIGENAMFLQQDLRLTTSQLNEYMKSEITRKLQEEFSKYEESITDAKQMAVDSINKTQQAIEQQRTAMGQQLQEELAAEKKRYLERFENNMAEVVNHYVMAAIGNQIDLNDQLEYIINEMQANKDAIIRDLTNGT